MRRKRNTGKRAFYAMGARAASLGWPRWLVHRQCPTALSPLWAVLAWLEGFDNQSQWRRFPKPQSPNRAATA